MEDLQIAKAVVLVGHIAWIFAQIFAALLFADFVSGLLHWFEDRYCQTDWPILGKYVAQPNELHHIEPRAFVADGFIERNWASFAVSGLLLVNFALFEAFNAFTVALVLISAVLPTQAHYWAHRTKSENGGIIRACQKLGLLQSSKQHWIHHRGEFNTYFCVMTNFVNPVLEKIKFFQTIEKLIERIWGIKPKMT